MNKPYLLLEEEQGFLCGGGSPGEGGGGRTAILGFMASRVL